MGRRVKFYCTNVCWRHCYENTMWSIKTECALILFSYKYCCFDHSIIHALYCINFFFWLSCQKAMKWKIIILSSGTLKDSTFFIVGVWESFELKLYVALFILYPKRESTLVYFQKFVELNFLIFVKSRFFCEGTENCKL